jgi:hypothetical protein
VAHGMTVIDDDAGQDGDHREHAGREGQQQAEAEEADQHQRQVVALEQTGDARAFVAGGGGLSRLAAESRRWR